MSKKVYVVVDPSGKPLRPTFECGQTALDSTEIKVKEQLDNIRTNESDGEQEKVNQQSN